MLRKHVVHCLYAGIAGLVVLPGVAFAQSQAITNVPADLRAGPAGDYPVVAQLPGGAPVTVMGCVAGYSWCDVALPNLRGWVYGGSLSYPYQGNDVPILQYGPSIGLPIVAFSLGAYWNSYYRGRPWYNDRGRWENHGRPGFGGGRPGFGGPGRPGGGRPEFGGGRPGGRPGGGDHVGGRPGGGRPGGGGVEHGGGRPGGGGGRPGGGGGRPGGGGGHGGGGGGHGGGSHER
jgi:uncharacterized protein YraI